MRIRDTEDLIESIRTYLKSNLNTQITAINAQKLADDSTTFQLDAITADDDHYLTAINIEDLPNRTFVMIGLNSPFEIEKNDTNYAIIVALDIEVIFQRPHNPNGGKMAFRYMQALLNTMLGYEPATQEVAGMQITGGIPMEITSGARKLITGGVTVNIKLA